MRTPEYLMIRDVCHLYGTMLYYGKLEAQRRQLQLMLSGRLTLLFARKSALAIARG